MNISVVGTGYVGLVCGAGLAEVGNSVVCVDTDADKIASLEQGIIPIYEPGLEEVVKQNVANGSLTFTVDIGKALAKTDICFIAVGTPMSEDGSADTQHVLEVARSIGRLMDKHMFVINKSTVPVGTGGAVRACIEAELQKRGVDLTFDVISNPEFLKEGVALSDFMKPDRVIVGVDNERSLKVMHELYEPFTKNHDNFIAMEIPSAEMTKYAANAMLACKISFMNEIARICEKVGADINKVRIGIGSDSRIGYHFLYAGCGYGGSCFPKDVQALIRTSRANGCEASLLRAVESVNQDQKMLLVEKAKQRLGENLSGKVFAVWGLAFKPGTDDMRDAPSLTVVNKLIELGATLRVYDPKAISVAKKHYFGANPSITYCDSKYEAVKGVDALFLLTEWKEFRSPDFAEMVKLMHAPIIFDGRNQYQRDRMAEHGFEYHQIGSNTLPLCATRISNE